MLHKQTMHSIQNLIKLALQEDIGSGDITTNSLIDPERLGRGVIIAKEPLVIAGIETACMVFEQLDPNVKFKSLYKDGDLVGLNNIILEAEGKYRALLTGERTALNFLQRLSGIATCVRSFVDELKNRKVRLVDTRKTTPGWRVLEKSAVRAGGASNHRMGLYDGVLIKDNHISACGGVKNAINRIKKKTSHLTKIEVEVSNLLEVKEALDAGADIIMLDNMDIPAVKEAVAVIDGRATVEVSGSIRKEDLLNLANTGVDIISSGAFTHSAGSVDISMRIAPLDQISSVR